MSAAQDHASSCENNDEVAPSVGIFWAAPDSGASALVTDATELRAAEPYGEFLTHPRGHYEVWEAWRRLGPVGLARRGLPAVIAFYEYDDVPRGRVVYDVPASLFVIYADRKLHGPDWMARIIGAFGLTRQRATVRPDAHYRT